MIDISVPSILLGAASVMLLAAVVREYVLFRDRSIKLADDVAALHTRLSEVYEVAGDVKCSLQLHHHDYMEQFEANGRAFIKINESVVNLESRLFPPEIAAAESLQTIMASYEDLVNDFVLQGFDADEAARKAADIIMDKVASHGLTESIGVTNSEH